MNKLSITTLLLLSISFGIFAIEPTAADCVWDNNLTVKSVYIGDYNTNLGQIFIYCSNNRTYSMDLGTDLANLVYASAMNAISKSKRLDFYRSVTKNNDSYTIYRVNFRN